MRVVGYIRVSTEDQAQEGISLEAQQERIAAYCVANDWQLLAVEADKGLSAKDLNRPGLQTALQLLAAHEAEALVVYKLDRLTRSVVDLHKLVELLSKHEAALVSMQEHLDATTPAGRLMMNLLACVSEWEREVIGQRTKEAMSYLREQQKVYSRPVFGYDCKEGRLFVNEQEQATIEQARAMRALGYSYESIAARLNSQHVPAKRGGQWQATTVRRIVLKSS